MFSSELIRIFLILSIINAPIDNHVIFIVWISLQIVFSVVGGALSDRFSRKYMLAIAAFAKLIAGHLCFHEFFLLSICVDGIFGNYAPIARAAYCDVHVGQGIIPNIVNTFFMLP
jgi:hypothetical protein